MFFREIMHETRELRCYCLERCVFHGCVCVVCVRARVYRNIYCNMPAYKLNGVYHIGVK